MNKKQFEIWEKQRWRDYEIELDKLRGNFAQRGLAFSGMRNKAERDLKERYDSKIEIVRLGISNTEGDSLFSHTVPSHIGNGIWFWKVIHEYAGKKIKNNFLRGIFYAILILIIGFLALRFGTPLVRDTGYFQYQPQEITYGSKSASQSRVIRALFQGDIRNISSSPRYLRNFMGVLWKNEDLGSTLSYTYSTDVADVYSVQGPTTTLITLPIRFEPNEAKTLQWRFEINATDDPEILSFLSEQTCREVFCWNKNQFSILTVDSRGNIFDENGNLQSQEVIDSWWVFPNNRTFLEKLSASIQLSFQIICWKLGAIIPVLK